MAPIDQKAHVYAEGSGQYQVRSHTPCYSQRRSWPRGQLEAVIDTGFNGSLTLPSATIKSLGLLWRARGAATLANGTTEQFDIYAAVIVWDGAPRNILVEEAEMEPLLGMALLRGYDLSLQVIPGGSVFVTALP